jgi:ABC-type nitrate/sulfonate/bicarbonate transport system ATPase subunit
VLRKYVPFSVLDAVSRMQVEQEFASVIDRMRSTTVVVTHNANEGVVFPDRTVRCGYYTRARGLRGQRSDPTPEGSLRDVR